MEIESPISSTRGRPATSSIFAMGELPLGARFFFALAGASSFAGAAGAQSQSLTVEGYPIEIIFEPRNERVARRVQEICIDELPRLIGEVGLSRPGPIRIDVVDDLRPYRHAFRENLPVWGVAFALLRQQIIVVDAPRATRAFNSLEQVIPHELSHILLAQRVGPVGFPIWFVEGMAKWQAREWSIVDGWQLMNAVWSKKAPPLWRLINEYPASAEEARNAYRVSYAAYTDLFDGRFDELPLFLDAVVTAGSFQADIPLRFVHPNGAG